MQFGWRFSDGLNLSENLKPSCTQARARKPVEVQCNGSESWALMIPFMKFGDCSCGSCFWWGHPGPLTVVIRLINSEDALAASQLR